jgi:hypothetical protein
MHDFIQSLSFIPNRSLVLSRTGSLGWVQRGIMRSFGEDDVVAPYLSMPRRPDRGSRKMKARNRK